MAELLPLEEAFTLLDRAILSLPDRPRDTLPVNKILGRTLAQDVLSGHDLPPFDKSLRDGYAVGEAKTPDHYQLRAERVWPGMMPEFSLQPGEAVRIFTGAVVPEGTAQVVMQEKGVEEQGGLRVIEPDGASYIARQGSDRSQGQRILGKGTLLGPLEQAVLISAGITHVAIYPQTRLYVLSTGDELMKPGAAREAGKIADLNQPLLSQLARENGFDLLGMDQVRDEKAEWLSALQFAFSTADWLVCSGGVSVGEADLAPGLLRSLGFEILFERVAVKPGKPCVMAKRSDGKIAFGLPGNPVSAFVTFQLYVKRALALLESRRPVFPCVKGTLAENFQRADALRREFWPVVQEADGRWRCLPYNGSHQLDSLLGAEAFLVIPEGVKTIPAGAECTVWKAWGKERPCLTT